MNRGRRFFWETGMLIFVGTGGSKREFTFAYDTLYEVGYIEENGRKLEPDYSFFRYIQDLREYKNPDTNVEQRVIQLFDRYNWTVDYIGEDGVTTRFLILKKESEKSGWRIDGVGTGP
jgi:hypothetical protein